MSGQLRISVLRLLSTEIIVCNIQLVLYPLAWAAWPLLDLFPGREAPQDVLVVKSRLLTPRFTLRKWWGMGFLLSFVGADRAVGNKES